MAAAPSNDGGGGAPIGAIVGGAVGGAALALALAGLLWYKLGRRARKGAPPASASPSGSAGEKDKSASADTESGPFGGGLQSGGGAQAYAAHELSPAAAAVGWAGSTGAAYAAPGAYTPVQPASAGVGRPPLPPGQLAGSYRQQPSRIG